MCLSLFAGLLLPLVFGVPADEAAAPIPFVAGEAVKLPPPRTDGGVPLMRALAGRRSSREFASRPLTRQQLGDLLWAAWGINRPTEGKHTAPTARNWQDMSVYAVLPEGTFLYDPAAHALLPKVAGDHRAATGRQDFCAQAPLNLVFVSDYARLDTDDALRKERYAGSHAGFISQNVSLFCASEGLATVVRAYFDEELLHQTLALPNNQHPIFAQTVGYPKQ